LALAISNFGPGSFDTKGETTPGGLKLVTANTLPEQNQKTIADYLGDINAVESHIEEALDRQLDLFPDQPEAQQAVQGFHDMVKAQRDHVATLLEEEPKGSVTNTVKDVGSTLLGKAAGMIDKVRTESQSKALRDDYVAFNLAAISYSMLYTTASALGNTKVAAVAEKHLTGYAGAVQKINDLLPSVVLHELKKDDHQIENAGVVEQSRKVIDRAWKVTAN
jgi:ferritin-like metal-binding protein YciE